MSRWRRTAASRGPNSGNARASARFHQPRHPARQRPRHERGRRARSRAASPRGRGPPHVDPPRARRERPARRPRTASSGSTRRRPNHHDRRGVIAAPHRQRTVSGTRLHEPAPEPAQRAIDPPARGTAPRRSTRRGAASAHGTIRNTRSPDSAIGPDPEPLAERGRVEAVRRRTRTAPDTRRDSGPTRATGWSAGPWTAPGRGQWRIQAGARARRRRRHPAAAGARSRYRSGRHAAKAAAPSSRPAKPGSNRPLPARARRRWPARASRTGRNLDFAGRPGEATSGTPAVRPLGVNPLTARPLHMAYFQDGMRRRSAEAENRRLRPRGGHQIDDAVLAPAYAATSAPHDPPDADQRGGAASRARARCLCRARWMAFRTSSCNGASARPRRATGRRGEEDSGPAAVHAVGRRRARRRRRRGDDRAERDADDHSGRQEDRRLANQRRGVGPGPVEARRCHEHASATTATAMTSVARARTSSRSAWRPGRASAPGPVRR